MQKVGYECRVMGVPKTIDNDLFGTDHCPGYASAAKYIATSMHGGLSGRPRVRHRHDHHHRDHGPPRRLADRRRPRWPAVYGAGPDLIYLPETDFDMAKFMDDVKRIYNETGNCIVAVSEGIHYADGAFVSEAKTAATDGFGHAQLGGLATMLAEVLKEETGAKVRGIELNLLQRCAAHLRLRAPISRSPIMAGKAAVEAAVDGHRPARWSASSAVPQDGKYACKHQARSPDGGRQRGEEDPPRVDQ